MLLPSVSAHANKQQQQTILITGGSKGLGLNAARQLAGKGANVMIAARGEAALEDAMASISVNAPSIVDML